MGKMTFGPQALKKVYFGTSEVKKIFYGSSLVYSSDPNYFDWNCTAPVGVVDDIPYMVEEVLLGAYYVFIKYFPSYGNDAVGVSIFYDEINIPDDEWATWTQTFAQTTVSHAGSYIQSMQGFPTSEFLVKANSDGSTVSVYSREPLQ